MESTRENVGAKPYHEICREERSHAAVFYALLCREENLWRFVESCTNAPIPERAHPAPYFEYAYLRDFWATMTSEARWKCLRRWLPIKLGDEIAMLRDRDLKEANERLGVVGRASSRELQMPGRWGVARIIAKNPNMPKDDLLTLCKLKWSFNIKPDILIELGGNRTICVEAKVCSGQGSYPASAAEKKAIKEIVPAPFGQMEMQMYMLADLLGRQVTMVSLTRNQRQRRPAENEPVPYVSLTWGEVYDKMDTSGLPPSALAMIGWLKGTQSC